MRTTHTQKTSYKAISEDFHVSIAVAILVISLKIPKTPETKAEQTSTIRQRLKSNSPKQTSTQSSFIVTMYIATATFLKR